MNTIKIRFAGLAVICLVTLLAQNGIAQQQQWRSWQDSIAYGEQLISYSEQSMTLDDTRNVWALYEINDSTRQFGVVKFDGNTWTHFPLDRGVLYGIIRDSKGNLWVSADSGISEFINGVWQDYEIQDRYTGVRKYLTLAADSSGNIWVACLSMVFNYWAAQGIPNDTDVPEVFRFDGTNFTPFPIHVFFPEGWAGIRSFAVAPNGIVWAAGYQPIDSNQKEVAGLWRFDVDGESWTAINLDNGIDTNGFIDGVSLQADAKGGVWVTMSGFSANFPDPPSVNYFDGAKWDRSALTGDRFTRVWLAPNGDKYFRSKNGIVTVNDAGSVDSIPNGDIPIFPFNDVEFAANGSIWLSASYDGVILESTSAVSGVTTSSNAESTASAYPNPFHTSTNISYSLAEGGYVTILLFNSAGVCVASLASENEAAGEHTLTFDGSNLMDGIYRAEIQSVGSEGSVKRQSIGLSLFR